MTNRAANATIKGYFYQFDHTIVRLLEAASPQSSVVVEGIEDVDIEDGQETSLVQCKYYEGSEYNHSLIKNAVIQMLRHFHASGCGTGDKFGYRIYGHYKSGTHKLKSPITIDFLKKNFLTYVREKTAHAVHEELGLTDSHLLEFQSHLQIEVNALSYDDQQAKIIRLLTAQIPACQPEDARTFYYPNAINLVQGLAIASDAADRRITRAKFLSGVNRKDVLFSSWLRQKFGSDYYAKIVKRKHFKFPAMKVSKAARIFSIDFSGEADAATIVNLLARLGKRMSHVEHKRTAAQDRFCPYVIVRNVPALTLVDVKSELLRQGVDLSDGYPFQGSAFDPVVLAANPTKERPIKLKFVPAPEQIAAVVAEIVGQSIEVFDFFKSSQLDTAHIPPGVPCHAIRIDTAIFIDEVI